MKNVISLKSLVKFIAVLIFIGAFLLESLIVPFDKKRNLIQYYSKRVLKILEIDISNLESAPELNNGLSVCNHISYIDILVIASQYPSLFITSMETKESGWVGKLCQLAGCLFVDRRRILTLKNETSQLNDVLLSGTPVVLFPEATSSNGKSILPFRSSLYECAIQAQVPIHTLCIHYGEQNEIFAYYGDISLLPHLFKICSLERTTVSLHLIATLPVDQHTSRKYLAEKSFQLIREDFCKT